MAADRRRVFNVVTSGQFTAQVPSQRSAVSSLDASKSSHTSLTRDSGVITRESRGEMPTVGFHENGSKRQHGPNSLPSTAGGLAGFAQQNNEDNTTIQNISGPRFFSIPAAPRRFLDQPVGSRNSTTSNAPNPPRNEPLSPSFSKPVQSLVGALGSTHEASATDFQNRHLSSRRQPRGSRARSSTPFLPQDGENDAENQAPVDFAVFQSLLVAQGKKDKVMKEQDENLLRLEQQVHELQGQNSKLLSEIDRIKHETKIYIQTCKKMVQTAQEDAKQFQSGSREAYQKCIDDVQERIRDLQGSRDDLKDKMQDVEALLLQEHQHRSEIGPDLLRALEASKHEADFLRDKLFDVTNNLAEAKGRATELEGTIGEENTVLKHTLQLLEASNLQAQTENSTRYREEIIRLTEVEKQLRDKLQSNIEEMGSLAELKFKSDEELKVKEIEVARLHDVLKHHEEKISDSKLLPDEILKLRESLHHKENEFIALQSKRAVANKQIEELQEKLTQDGGLRERLEQTLRSYNALEAQQKEHLSTCAEQKAKLQQTEQDLKTLQAQHTQVKIRLEAASINLQNKELDFDEQTVVLRETKRQMLDLQNEAAEAQEELKKLQTSTNLQHEKDLYERKVLQSLIDQRTADVQNLSNELNGIKSERFRLEFQRDTEASGKQELEVRLDQLKHDADRERAMLQQNLNAVEKQLEAANASLQELRQRIAEQKLEIDATLDGKALLAEKMALAEEIKTLKDKLVDASQLAEQKKMSNGAIIENHLKEIARISALHHEAQQTIAVTQTESDQMKIRIQQLENQISQQVKAANLRTLEIQQANDRWEQMERTMETMASDMLDAKLAIKATAELTASAAQTANAANTSNPEANELANEVTLVLPEGQMAIDSKTLDDLHSRIAELTSELDILQSHSSHLEASAMTLVDRHKKGELTTEETELVKHVVQSTMQVNQKELVQKSNELKRREMICQTLHNRVKELEKQLASQLKDKQQKHQQDQQQSAIKNLFNYSDIMHSSSPLSNLNTMQSIKSPEVDAAAKDATQCTEQETVAIPSRIIETAPGSTGADADTATGNLKGGIHHHHQGRQERRLFADLNRQGSDEGDYLLRHSDKSPSAQEALPTVVPPVQPPAAPQHAQEQIQTRSIGAGIKRRREDDERVEKTLITTRATRKQRLSNSHNGGNASNGGNGVETKTNARGIKRLGVNGGLGGTGEGASGAIAKYKAQRNKQR